MNGVGVRVPFADLYKQYLSIKEEIDAAIADVIASSAFVRGSHVIKFEEDFARAIGTKYCVSCGNGTDALYIAMRALDVKSGDEIIAPAHSWISTSEAITQAGGKVVFCDTDPDTFTIDPSQIEARITPRTVGIIPVHIFGQAADMDSIMTIASRYGLWVIEDCAQAHLARYKARTVGTFGAVATFSFYPGKNLGAMGDAGAIVTASSSLAERMAVFARHGGLTKGEHRIEGVNSRLDGLQAAILSVKLKYLRSWTERRQLMAARYNRELKGIGDLVLPVAAAHCEHVWHLYVLQVERRDELAAYLSQRGIQTVINYPVALPFLPAYRRLRHAPRDFPVAHSHQGKILSVPLFAEMAIEQQDWVVSTLRNFFLDENSIA